MAEPAPQAIQKTVLGLIAQYGHTPAPRVEDFVRLGAAAQDERHRLGASDVSALTRSTALWAILHLDDEIAEALEKSRITEVELGRVLSLDPVPRPAPVDDVEVHEELARALGVYLGLAGSLLTIELLDIALAILRDVEVHGGLLSQRLLDAGADVAGALESLERRFPSGPTSAATKGEPPPAISDATGLYLGFYEASRTWAKALAPDAADIDGRALWSAFGLVASHRRGTLATVVALTVLELRGVRASARDGSVGLRAFDLTDDLLPVPVEDVDLAGHPLLVSAGDVRDRVTPGEVIHLRHLVAVAIELGPGPRDPETREQDVDAVRSAFLDQIGRDAPPDVVAAWHTYFDEAAAERRRAALVVQEPSGRAVAGLDVDVVADGMELTDELHVVDDVVTLCDMLAARGSVPPISVGLFGRWGSGKSYFMALMRRRIDELRNAAADAKKRGDATSYCSEVVQVTFNAWHYMDADDLWATLAVHLFSAIAQVDPDDDRARPRADVVRDLEERERQMEGVDRRITRALGDHRLDEAAARMGLASTREDVLGLVREIGTTVGYASAGKVLLTKTGRTRRRLWSVVALAVTVLVLVALAGLMVWGTVSTGWLLAWVPLAVTVVGTAGKWLRGIKKGLAEVNGVAARSGLQPRDLTAERIANDGRMLALRDELEAIDRLTGIRDSMRERALSTDYTSHFGVISVLRGDLEALVEKQRDAPDRRIILYIDDLDRCEPRRVVEVLQAVHLLLAFPLFVAVVGVDPRWLLRSLERHYRQVLSTSDGGSPRAVDDLLTETTPHDYLEKIFQIPFSLRRMQPDGYGRLVASLAGPPAASVVADPSPGDGDAAAAAATADAIRSAAAGSSAAEGPAQAAQAAQATEPGQGPASAPAPGPLAEPVDGPPSIGPAAPRELPPVSVNPPQLQVTELEVAALAQVGPLIGTPRAAKRLVNLYRLIRAGLADDDVEQFVADAQYRSLAIVLAAQVGFARVSSAFLAELVRGDDGLTITQRIDALPPLRADRRGPDRADWESLKIALRAVCVDAEGRPRPKFDRPLPELRTWIPRLRRYSFEGALGSGV